VTIIRDVETDEEKAERLAEREASERRWSSERIARNCFKAAAKVAAAKAKLVELAQSDARYIMGDRLADAAFDVGTAEEELRFAHRVVQIWVHHAGDIDVLAAFELAVESLKNDIIQRGADDRWSGRGNDFKRACFETKLEIARDSRWRWM
jgi:hypothetical protein